MTLKLLAPSRASTQQDDVTTEISRPEVPGKEIADENLVTTIFRWPAALGGKDVSVVGGFPSLCVLQLSLLLMSLFS